MTVSRIQMCSSAKITLQMAAYTTNTWNTATFLHQVNANHHNTQIPQTYCYFLAGSPLVIFAKGLDCSLEVTKYKRQSCYNVHSRFIPLERYETPYPSSYGFDSTPIVLQQGRHEIIYEVWYGIKQRHRVHYLWKFGTDFWCQAFLLTRKLWDSKDM